MSNNNTVFLIKTSFPVAVIIGCFIAYAYVNFVKESAEKRIIFYKTIESNSSGFLNKIASESDSNNLIVTIYRNSHSCTHEADRTLCVYDVITKSKSLNTTLSLSEVIDTVAILDTGIRKTTYDAVLALN